MSNDTDHESETEVEESEQMSIDPYREMNRYLDREGDFRSSAVFEPPRRTLGDGWQKFHAARDCGSHNVYFIEDTTTRNVTSDKYEYHLRCGSCGHRVDEDEVLFIGGEWFNRHGILHYGRGIENLRLSAERVLALGPDPDVDLLVDALSLARIEREASFHGVSFENERYEECSECGNETMLTFDNRCRMCYDGEWTPTMQQTVKSLGLAVLRRNGSFAHRVETEVDPLAINDRAHSGKILWAKRSDEPTPKVVEVQQVFEDVDDGHYEYILSDLAETREWRYHQSELDAAFYDTGLSTGDGREGIRTQIDQLRDRPVASAGGKSEV